MGWWGGLFDYSVKPGPDLSRLRLSLVRLVTRSIKARLGKVGDQVSQVKDQVGQGQGEELDKNKNSTFLDTNMSSSYLKLGTKFILSLADSLTPPVTRAQNLTYPETKAESLTQPVTVADILIQK